MLNPATLYDLDILCPMYKDKATLWERINYCRTTGGKEELKKIISLKDHSLENTLQRQQAISYICDKSNHISFPITGNEVFYLQHYLDSNYTIDTTNTKLMLAVKSYAKLAVSKGDYLYILSAVKQSLLIISQIKNIYEQLYSQGAPALLKSIFKEIELCLGKLQVKDADILLNKEPNPMMLYTADRQLRLFQRDTIHKLLCLYFRVEALCSLAKAHRDMKLVFPVISNTLTLTGLGHPLVKNCVTNDVCLNNEYILLVTGPNMAGKSTFLKSLGLAFVMAYIGIGIEAKYAELPFLHIVSTSINTEDDIGNGYSYFYSEVLKVKEMATLLATEPSTLIIADELFRGTNVKDANDCTETVISGLLKHTGGLFIMAIHLVETVKQYTGNTQCRLLCFDGSVDDGAINFDYKVKEGISVTRLGKHIMEQENIPQLFGL